MPLASRHTAEVGDVSTTPVNILTGQAIVAPAAQPSGMMVLGSIGEQVAYGACGATGLFGGFGSRNSSPIPAPSLSIHIAGPDPLLSQSISAPVGHAYGMVVLPKELVGGVAQGAY